MKYKTNDSAPTLDLSDLEPYKSFLGVCKSVHTRSNYHQDLKVFKRFLDEDSISDPAKVQPIDLTRFVGQLTKTGKTPTGMDRLAYSTRTLKRIMGTVRSFYRFLAGIQAISTDPTAVFHNMPIRSPKRNPRPLPLADRYALIQHLKMDNPEARRISLSVLLGLHCGLRVSESAGLRIRDVDLKASLLSVIGKGDKERTIPLTDPTKDLLQKVISDLANNLHTKASKFVFPSPRDITRPIHIRYLETWVRIAASWANLTNLEDITVHVLRHTFGTQLAESGASVYEIRDLMGHSSIVVSENYVQLASTGTREAHRRAFPTNWKKQALLLADSTGPAAILKLFRARQPGR
jgi:site-specific recombinase XerD